jgi:hypothetical protein
MNNAKEFDKHILISLIEKLNSCIIIYPESSCIFTKYAKYCLKNNDIFNRKKIITMMMMTQSMKNVTHVLDFIFTFLTKEQINDIDSNKSLLDIAMENFMMYVSFDCVKSLIRNGANIFLSINNRITPFYKMITYTKLKHISDYCIELIDSMKLNPYTKYGNYTLMEFIMRANIINYDILDKFISMGYDFDYIFPNGNSLLMNIVEYRINYVDIYVLVKYLVKNKCNIHYKNKNGENILCKIFNHQFASEDVKKTIRFLVKNGIDINACVKSVPLIFKIIDKIELYDCLDLFDIFYEKGINYNLKFLNITLFFYICNQHLTNKKIYIIKKLLETDCDINQNYKGMIPFCNIVKNRNQKDLVNILINRIPWQDYEYNGKKIYEICLPEYITCFHKASNKFLKN